MSDEPDVILELVDEPSTIEQTVLCPMCGTENSVEVRECFQCGEPQLGYVAGSAGSGLWRDGHLLVARKNAVFSDRCLETNLPVKGERYEQCFYLFSTTVKIVLAVIGIVCLVTIVVHPISGIAILVPTVMVTFFLQKTATLKMGILPRLRSEIRAARFICRVFIFGIFIIFTLIRVMSGGGQNTSTTLFWGVAAMVVAIIFYHSSSQFMRVTKITKGFIWIKGSHHNFLRDLPQWQGE